MAKVKGENSERYRFYQGFFNADELIAFLTSLSSKQNYVFRGFGKQSELFPNLIREKDWRNYEIALLSDFERYGLQYFSANNPDSLILDFFAGSGTTGQAVLEMNQRDNGNRRFILCTNNEANICEEVTYERIRRVINGYGKQAGLPANLQYFRPDFVSMDDEYLSDALLEHLLIVRKPKAKNRSLLTIFLSSTLRSFFAILSTYPGSMKKNFAAQWEQYQRICLMRQQSLKQSILA